MLLYSSLIYLANVPTSYNIANAFATLPLLSSKASFAFSTETSFLIFIMQISIAFLKQMVTLVAFVTNVTLDT